MMAGEAGMTPAVDRELVGTGCLLVMRFGSSVDPVAYMNLPGMRGQIFSSSPRMLGMGQGVVKCDLSIRRRYSNPMISQNISPYDITVSLFLLAFKPVLLDHESGCANNLYGVTRIATRSFTVRHTCSHSPHPTQRSAVTTSRCVPKSIERASVGHFDAQAWHPCPAVQTRCETIARPIRICPRPSTGSNASVAQAAMQGTSSQR